MTTPQTLQLILLGAVIIGSYLIRRRSELSLAGSLVAECIGFSILIYFVIPIQNHLRELAMLMIACLIGTLFAEVLPRKNKSRNRRD